MMKQTNLSSNLTVKLYLHGYSTMKPEEIVAAIDNGNDISSIAGDFVVYNPSPTGGFAISSFVSALPFYYAISPMGSLIMGDNVFDVAYRSKKEWKWNLSTIQCLALYGHSLNQDTLCEGVFRIPPGSRVTVNEGKVSIIKLDICQFSWDNVKKEANALQLLQTSFDHCVQNTKDVHLSLSAGYDSRLLLALCLNVGIKPNISVMGYNDSTDVVIAKEICKRLAIPLEVIEIRKDDYLELGGIIAKDTSGVKTAINWHTYIYSRAKDFSQGIHLVGSNGEFARTFFFDAPIFNVLSKQLPQITMNAFWFAKCFNRLNKFSKFNPLLNSGKFAPFEMAKKAHIDDRWCTQKFLPAMDAFYAEQRVRHFIGAGLACYATFGSPRSPFLDGNWMRAITALSRDFKQGNLYHSTCTKKLNPALSKCEYNRLPNKVKGNSYHPFNDLAKSNVLSEVILDSSYLDQWLSRNDRAAILNDQRCNQLEERNFWLTLHFAAKALSDSNFKH